MPVPTTVEELFALARKSGAIAEETLAAYVRDHQPVLRLMAPAQAAAALVRAGLITRFHAEVFLQGKCRGLFLGNYLVLERLGAGGMAVVYLARRRDSDERVAIKILPTASAQNVEHRKRFYREARATALLDHPNIVRAYEYEIDPESQRHFLVMEYIDGILLGDLVKQYGPLDMAQASSYIRQAALGLQHAHEAGLVHRDVKPDNLIVDTTGTIKVLDLGLARVRDDGEEVLTDGILGTPDYLAPEQCQDSHRVDIRADIYSLGGTFYFLLTGRTPFGDGSMSQKLQWHQTREPAPVGLFRPEVPDELEAILIRMMAKFPDRRFQTPAEVAEVLAPWAMLATAPPDPIQVSSAAAVDLAATPVVNPRGLPRSPTPRPSGRANGVPGRNTPFL